MQVARFVGPIALLASCHASPNTPGDAAVTIEDARVDAPADAPAAKACGAGFSQLVVPYQGSTFASNGTSLFIAGLEGLKAMPLAGGTLASIATADDGMFYLTSHDTAVFYAAHLGSSAYAVHEVFGGSDIMLGSVDALGDLRLAANATDVYVLGSDAPDDLSLWRVPRGSGSATVVASLANSSPYAFAIGSGAAAWLDNSGVEVVSIPGPSTPTTGSASGQWLAFVGSAGYAFSEDLETSHADNDVLTEFTPALQSTSRMALCSHASTFFGDSRGDYFYAAYDGAPCGESVTIATGLYIGSSLNLFGNPFCNFDPTPIVAQDDNALYSVAAAGSGSTTLLVIAKP